MKTNSEPVPIIIPALGLMVLVFAVIFAFHVKPSEAKYPKTSTWLLKHYTICRGGVSYYEISIGASGSVFPAFRKDTIPKLILCDEDDE